jgi:hypothetical protein
MTYEEALKKLKYRTEEDMKDIVKEQLRLNGKYEAYQNTVDRIDSLLQEIKKNEDYN